MKKKINSRTKGQTWERKVCKIMQERTGEEWYRTPGSGAFATVHNIDYTEFKGDIFCKAPEYKNLVVECKSYKELKITELFNTNSKLYMWINQAIKEAKGSEWLLFVKINNLGEYEVYEYDYKGERRPSEIMLANGMRMSKLK